MKFSIFDKNNMPKEIWKTPHVVIAVFVYFHDKIYTAILSSESIMILHVIAILFKIPPILLCDNFQSHANWVRIKIIASFYVPRDIQATAWEYLLTQITVYLFTAYEIMADLWKCFLVYNGKWLNTVTFAALIKRTYLGQENCK